MLGGAAKDVACPVKRWPAANGAGWSGHSRPLDLHIYPVEAAYAALGSALLPGGGRICARSGVHIYPVGGGAGSGSS